MEIIRRPEDLEARRPSVVTVGVFDGVHLGHQTIMHIVKADAAERNTGSVAITFDRLPEDLINPAAGTRLITTLDQKLELIAEMGMDLCVVMPLEQELLDMPAERFVTDILRARLHTVQLVVGTNFAFGKGRAGNVSLLRQMGPEMGFEVVGVSPIKLDGSLVSSTVIRRLIAEGNIDRANKLLGHPFAIQGKVVPGDGIGQTLGFPTANIEPLERQVIPPKGVYAVTVKLDGASWIGAMNIGIRPTVDGRENLAEVYIVGFSGNIYGRELRVVFHHRLRDELRFRDVDALKRQIQADVQRIVEMLSTGNG